MSREVRRVPVDYEWPKELRSSYTRGEHMAYVQMFDMTLREAQEQWDSRERLWREGKIEELLSRKDLDYTPSPEYVEHVRGAYSSFEEFADDRPGSDPEEDSLYRPEWPPDAKLGYVVCQTVGEGSPVTPIFETQEELVDYLVEHGTQTDDGRQWDPPMSRAAAEEFVFGRGWVPTLVRDGDGEVMSGLEALERSEE